MSSIDFQALVPADTFRALGDPQRLRLLQRLACASEPQPVSEIATCCGVHLSGVSRHLKILADAGIVSREKVGREVLYRLDCKALVSVLEKLVNVIEGSPASCCDGEC